MALTKTLLCCCVLSAIFGIALSEGPPRPGVLWCPEESPEDSWESEESYEGPRTRMLLPSVKLTTCNYTTEPGLSCASCNQVMYCRRNNVGILRNCGFLRRYCNIGRCSFFPEPACDATTTAKTTTGSSTTTEGSTTTVSSTTTVVSTTTDASTTTRPDVSTTLPPRG